MRVPLPTPRVAHLFPLMRAELLRVLRGLSDADWQRPTACAEWSVKDVALHLLGDDVGLLSNLRDHDGRYARIESFAELVAYINAQNTLWVQAMRRMSRELLISQLETLGAQWAAFAAGVDPEAPAGPIGWTGNAQDPMGLHLARELTEYWMHHQHICEAVGIDSLKDRPVFPAVLNTFVHCLPRTFQAAPAPAETLVKVIITGAGGGEWHLIRGEERWLLYASSDLLPASTITMTDDAAWRLFTKGIEPSHIPNHIQREGDLSLGQVIWDAVAILA